ncbi:acyl-CoA thioesterase [Halorientalis marina]|uniref:acyl-CoA thioesterase n=1 Tax=Halorientalis marina TaxID=2931976 RepID=UPI001FF31F92|nr:thioesterase family protein [Halorientalis marina]
MGHTTDIHVDWGDTDAGGLIYFPRFFHFAVVGLNDYFAPAMDGHLMESLRRDGFVLPAVDASGSFESPLRAGERAVVETEVTDLGEASLTVTFEVFRTGSDGSTDERAATLSVTFVLVDGDFEATPLPESVRECVVERGDGAAAGGA